MQDFIIRLDGKCPDVALDITASHRWEFMAYVQLARAFGYEVEVHEFMPETIGELKLCIARNVHKVPAEVVCRMVLEFEPAQDMHLYKVVQHSVI